MSVSLAELTELCSARTGVKIRTRSIPDTQPADVPFYVTDISRIRDATGWSPMRSVPAILDEVLDWLASHRRDLEPILS